MVFYFRNIDRDIKRLVRSCEAWDKIKTNAPKVIIRPWDGPKENWDRVHINYAGPFQNTYFLVCVDAKSKWVEVGTDFTNQFKHHRVAWEYFFFSWLSIILFLWMIIIRFFNVTNFTVTALIMEYFKNS